METFSILLRSFGEKDAEKILKIIGILFQYFFNISVTSIVLCIQCIEMFNREEKKASRSRCDTYCHSIAAYTL